MWVCSKCRESVEDNFDICWNCGANQDGSPSANQSEFDAARSELFDAPRAESTLAGLGRKWGRSRAGRIFGAIVVVVFFFVLAYIARHHRELAADVLTIGLAFYGLGVAWSILPIPASTRARWAMEDQKGGYRLFFYLGIGSLLSDLLSRGISVGLARSDFIVPGIFFVIGSVRLAIVRRTIRQAQSAKPKHGNPDCSGPARRPVS